MAVKRLWRPPHEPGREELVGLFWIRMGRARAEASLRELRQDPRRSDGGEVWVEILSDDEGTLRSDPVSFARDAAVEVVRERLGDHPLLALLSDAGTHAQWMEPLLPEVVV